MVKRALLGFSIFSSESLSTAKGDTYQVPNKGSKANKIDMIAPKEIPINMG